MLTINVDGNESLRHHLEIFVSCVGRFNLLYITVIPLLYLA